MVGRIDVQTNRNQHLYRSPLASFPARLGQRRLARGRGHGDERRQPRQPLSSSQRDFAAFAREDLVKRHTIAL